MNNRMTGVLLREYQTVMLGALLRGIDQHLPSGTDLISDWRSDFERCVDVDLLRTLVPRHRVESAGLPTAKSSANPRSPALARLIELAGSFASSESTPRDAGSPATAPSVGGLMPIFDRVELTMTHAPPPRHFRPRALTHTGEEPPIFASDGPAPSPDEFAAHLRELVQRLGRLREYVDWDRFDCVYAHLLALMQVYTWCIPTAARAASTDVPLYDYLRVSSAVAACLYQFHAAHDSLNEQAILAPNQARCMVLTGGVSGIQDYIFDISTIGAGGVAKRLRARSFFVQLLSEAASLRVLRAFSLPLTNLLMAAGGRFYVLLPALPDATERLNDLSREFDQWMLREFQGSLSVNLAWIDLPDEDFAAGRYDAALTRLEGLLRRNKARRLAGALQSINGWSQEFAREPFIGERVCLACRRFPATHFSSDRSPQEGEDICAQCAAQLGLGRRLTSGEFLSFFETDQGTIPCLGLTASLDDTPRGDAVLVIRLNNPDLSTARRVPATFRYLANHVPRHKDGTPRDFGDIAGGGLLGVLKADVDHLGTMIQEGLRRDAPDAALGTVCRLAALSRQIDWFFSGWLEWLLTTKYDDCYTVYAGGDDLLLIGPRSRTLALAGEIRGAFVRYTQHPEVTLSAGLAVVKPKLPLAHTVKQSDTALDRAKEAGRDRLSVLGQTFPWAELAPLIGEIGKLTECRPASGFLYHLMACADLWRQFHHDHFVPGLRYHALLAYYLARNVNARQQPALHEWTARLLQFPPRGEIERLLDRLPLVAQWVLLERREH